MDASQIQLHGDAPTGIENLYVNGKDIQISPNPVKDQLFIKANFQSDIEQIHLYIYNVIGQQIVSQSIPVSGVGGQGILSIATVIGKAALKEGLYMKQAEVHGMSQRGGDVQSNLRISDQPIASDLIPSGKCDLIISLEPMEGLRYLPYLSPEGWLVTNETPFVNIPNYPEEDKVMAEINKLPHKIVLNVDKVAKEVGSARVANIVLLGATIPFLGIDYEKVQDSIREIFLRKGEAIVEMNLKALAAGKEIAEKLM